MISTILFLHFVLLGQGKRVHHKNLVRTADADQALYNLNQLKNTSHNLCVPGIELRVFAFNLANLKKDDEAAY